MVSYPAVWLLAAGAVAGLAHTARASLPVPYAIVGCVIDAKFNSAGAAGPRLADPLIDTIEGKTIRVEGLLWPGDMFRANAIFIVDNRCLENLHKSYFLCNPCQTQPGGPESKSVSKQESATQLRTTPEALKQFDDWPRAKRTQ